MAVPLAVAEALAVEDRSLPARTGAAALLLGGAGWALGRALSGILAGIATPSFERYLRPARFAYGPPSGWGGSTATMWVLAGVCVLALPLLFNRTWASRRLLSPSGLLKLALAAALLAALAMAVLALNGVFASATAHASEASGSHAFDVILAGLGGGALFVVFGEGTIGGDPGRFVHRGVPRAASLAAFVKGFVATALVALLSLRLESGFALLFQALLGFLGESAEVSPLGWQRLQLALTVGLGLLGASWGAIVVALSPAPARRSGRIAALAIAAIPAVALLASVSWFERYCRDRELGTTFEQAAGLEPAPSPRVMVLPGDQGPKAYLYKMEAQIPGGFSDAKVGATAGNVERARRYLESRGGRWTAHTTTAWHAPAAIEDRLLRPDAALRPRADAAEATGSILSTMMLAGKIPNMPASDSVREVTARLLDKNRFIAGPQAGPAIAKLSGTVRDRTVTGVVEAPAGTRIALYKQADAKPRRDVPIAQQLVAAADAGKFTFEGLPAGFYAVGALVPATDPKQLSFEGALRLLDLTSEHAGDAGSLKIIVH